MTIAFPYSRINPQGKRAAWLVQQNLEYLAEQIGDQGSAAFVNVKDKGAKGDGTTDDTAAIATAIDSLPATGGIVVFPPGTYVASISITANKRIALWGCGSTIKPPASGIGIKVDTVSDQTAAGIDIDGFAFDGASGSVTGIQVLNSTRVYLRNLRFDDCAIAIELKATGSDWTESVVITNVFASQCTTGLKFNAASSNSFSDTILLEAQWQDCGVGIDIGAGAILNRSAFLHTTCFLAANQKGVRIDGDITACVMHIAVDCFSSTGTTGVEVASNAAGTELANIQLDLEGVMATPVSVASGKKLIYNRGVDKIVAGSFPSIRLWKQGDTWPKVDIEASNVGGLSFGGGSGAADISLWREAVGVLKTDGGMIIDDGVALGERATPTGIANYAILFAQDDGMGKTRLMVQFGSGAAQALAIEP